jgi:hypothetical protein
MLVWFKPAAYEKTRLVKLGTDDFGLYVTRGGKNEFGTGLAARGGFDEVLGFRRWCSLTRAQRAELKRASTGR